jgi:hypothetical protein
MGLNIRVHNITCPNSFTLSYRISPAPGNESVISTGYTQYGGTYVSSNSRDYNADPIVISGSTFDNIFDQTIWIKIKDSVTDGYIIENIKIHELEYYDYCIHCCDFSGGTGSYVSGPTPTPLPTSTPTPTASPTSTPTATPTPTPEPTATSTSTPTPTATDVPPTATSTPTPTPTETSINCVEYLITNTNDPLESGETIIVYYTGCTGTPESIEIAAGAGQSICAQELMYILPPAGAINIVGSCTPSPTSTPTPTPTPSPTLGETAFLSWSYVQTNGATGYMDLYVNGSIVESRMAADAGIYTVYVGDTINVEVQCNVCSTPNNVSNAYCVGIINDATSGNNISSNIFTAVYTVTGGDAGATLFLDSISRCDVGSV